MTIFLVLLANAIEIVHYYSFDALSFLHLFLLLENLNLPTYRYAIKLLYGTCTYFINMCNLDRASKFGVYTHTENLKTIFNFINDCRRACLLSMSCVLFLRDYG